MMRDHPHSIQAQPGARALDLADYRRLVALDVPFSPPPAAAPRERAALTSRLVSFLRGEGTSSALEARLRGLGGDVPSQRAALRALLTVRPPAALPPAFLEDLDRLLQLETREPVPIDPLTLPLLAQAVPGTRYPAANRTALWQGDITRLAADAIVNAANDALLGCFLPFHACIDNAIHSAAGPRLREDCDRIIRAQGHPEPVGEAKATRAYNLPARFVLHTVGPQVHGELRPAHADALASCYRASLDLAARLPGVRSLALCAISTGVFGYPKEAAARVALHTVASWLQEHPGALDLVVSNVFGDADRNAYLEALASPSHAAR